jgi:hypothetical protein
VELRVDLGGRRIIKKKTPPAALETLDAAKAKLKASEALV